MIPNGLGVRPADGGLPVRAEVCRGIGETDTGRPAIWVAQPVTS